MSVSFEMILLKAEKEGWCMDLSKALCLLYKPSRNTCAQFCAQYCAQYDYLFA